MTIDTIPQEHINDAFQLDADAKVDLFKIVLNQTAGSTILCLTAQQEVTWQGMTFESIPVTMSQEGVTTSGEWKRPKLTLANPDGIWSTFIAQGKLDMAQITRYRVLLTHVKANAGIYQMNTWRISKPLQLNKTLAVFELRSPLDGASFLLPGRAFYPPEYPHVSL
jgi:lambda family phage minor tail protein L